MRRDVVAGLTVSVGPGLSGVCSCREVRLELGRPAQSAPYPTQRCSIRRMRWRRHPVGRG